MLQQNDKHDNKKKMLRQGHLTKANMQWEKNCVFIVCWLLEIIQSQLI